MTMRSAVRPPTHPGAVLREDVFPALSISKPAFATALGVSRQTLHQLMTEQRSVSPEMALRLEAVVGSTAQTWLKLQAEHDLWSARRALDTTPLRRLVAAG